MPSPHHMNVNHEEWRASKAYSMGRREEGGVTL